MQERLLQLGKELTPVTQQSLQFSPELIIHINVPQVPHSSYWLSMQSSSASEKRRAQIWLEYLLWLAYLNDDARSPELERIVIFSNKTLKFSGLSSSKAHEYLQLWLKAWEIGQQQPLVLPAELLMKKEWQWAENEQGKMTIVEMPELLKAWNNSYARVPSLWLRMNPVCCIRTGNLFCRIRIRIWPCKTAAMILPMACMRRFINIWNG